MALKDFVIAANEDSAGVPIQPGGGPDACPICHHRITPLTFPNPTGYLRGPIFERPLQCPNGQCQRLFIAPYKATGVGYTFNWFESLPATTERLRFSTPILGVSKDYCEIYEQAHKAEKLGLHLIAGPGYRKALEFLIKDYLLKIYPTNPDKTAIETMLLGKCINTYIKNDRIKQTAERAAWLGNDETHFIRKWEDKDIQHLKVLIDLVVHWIEMELMTESVIQGMPTGRK